MRKKLIIVLAGLIFINSTCLAEVLVLEGNKYIDDAQIIGNKDGNIVFQHNGKFHQLNQKYILQVKPTPPPESGEALTVQNLENYILDHQGQTKLLMDEQYFVNVNETIDKLNGQIVGHRVVQGIQNGFGITGLFIGGLLTFGILVGLMQAQQPGYIINEEGLMLVGSLDVFIFVTSGVLLHHGAKEGRKAEALINEIEQLEMKLKPQASNDYLGLSLCIEY